MKKTIRLFVLLGVIFLLPALAQAGDVTEVGCVSTTFRLMGANDKICIEGFADPKVPGVVCHWSRARTGGMTGMVGMAEDPSNASLACRQIGPINKNAVAKLKDGEKVFQASTSVMFKTLQVVRMYDPKFSTLVYLVYSDKLIDGSPKNSISSVPIMKWVN